MSDGTRRWRAARRALQAAVAFGGCVPVGAGVMGVARGLTAFDSAATVSISADSHVRYLSGLLLGIGLGFWSTVPQLGYRQGRFALLTTIVVAGGLGRLFGAVEEGLPDMGMRFGLAMELCVTPLLCLAQAALVQRRHAVPDLQR